MSWIRFGQCSWCSLPVYFDEGEAELYRACTCRGDVVPVIGAAVEEFLLKPDEEDELSRLP